MIIELDLQNVFNKDQLHSLIQNKFLFEDYGYNLDSLYDQLTSLTDDIQIIIKNKNNNNYIDIFLKLLSDVEKECDNIKIIYK